MARPPRPPLDPRHPFFDGDIPDLEEDAFFSDEGEGPPRYTEEEYAAARVTLEDRERMLRERARERALRADARRENARRLEEEQPPPAPEAAPPAPVAPAAPAGPPIPIMKPRGPEKQKDVMFKAVMPKDSYVPKKEFNKEDFEGHKHRFETHQHILIIGPTTAGKTSLVKKILIDGWDHPLGGTPPFDKVFYVGNADESDEIAVGAQVMNWTYCKVEPGTQKSIPTFFLPKNDYQKLPSILKSEDNKDLKKLVIVDDTLKANTDTVANFLFNLVGEGQHLRATFIVIGHTVAGFKNLRTQFNIRILMKNFDSQDYATLFSKKPSAQAYYNSMINNLKTLKDEPNSLTKHLVVYNVLKDQFYDYKLDRISI